MFYFLSELSRDHYKLPWTFILLLAVSLLTILTLTTTTILHIYYGLNPVLNLTLNSALALLWALSFALLAWWCSGTLSHVCDKQNWDSETGISVCRMYKALFSFALLGCVATLVALGMDAKVMKGARRRGVFQPVGGNGKGGVDVDVHGHELEEHHGYEANAKALAARRNGGQEGYALPEEQFEYSDTGYQGAAGQVERRSLEERI
ncbi:hypothetical protein BDW02DRAFT_574414 [Decorospora gaudefroyi]|uniref:MARVEL domain-containing protein n=1 Tax=Decorospora gaudefroyi TaxID=184978 RepID=A0A6A5JWH8_9PLEO|nr:hypothetical protein BDW02DRAFT_574414 [Decorospora gaudefroyi]